DFISNLVVHPIAIEFAPEAEKQMKEQMKVSEFQPILSILLLVIFNFSTANGNIPLHEWTSQLEETNESENGRPLSDVEVDESSRLQLKSLENLITKPSKIKHVFHTITI
ncbi:MAG: hypothetical protein AB8B56_01550, partial [Crocinitomicaceae bacterium]